MPQHRTSGFFDKLIERVDRVEPGKVQGYLARLLKEKGFLEQVFEALQEGVLVCDPGGTLLYINRSACRFFGLEREEVIGGAVEECVKGVDWEALAASVEEGKVVSRDLEMFYPETRVLNFYLAPIAESSGYVMLVRDITKTKRLAEEQIESERINALTMLAAGVAHELGNPLNSLNIHLQLLERKLKKSAPETYGQVSDILEVARGEIKRLDFTIGQFLGAVRPTRPNAQLIDLNRTVTESVTFLEPELRDKGVDLTLELHGSLPLMEVDPDQMKQAFYNVIRNASQAMGGGGSLLIRSDVDDVEVRVRFEDSGGGIPGDVMGNLFEPYLTTKESGTGLGLLIVRRIVREHGGELEIESEEGVGTAVVIHLPRAERGMRLLEAKEASDEPEEEVD